MFKIEFKKLLNKKSTKTLLIIYGLLFLGLMGIYAYGEAGLGLSIYNSGQFTLSSLNAMMTFVLPFIVLYMTASTFVSEFKKGTIKNLYLLPVQKHEIYISKLLSVQSLVGILLIVQMVLSLIAGGLLDGIGLSLATITGYIGAFILLGLINVLSSLLSMFLNTSGMVVLVTYIAFMVLNVVGIMVPSLQTISISHMMGQYQMIFSSFSLLLSVIAYYILLSVVGYQLFDKKEAMICLSE
ncbi:hypothetical protein EZV73_16780 [Acidaminobacter sp. JC074]|uniref:ABC transporter permease n=1 Tax=Acidaminobacter sp. JC074 TaxID=2530199 RepID=UPI001F0E9A8F|nr:ABC transporter permease [Acidaminobacter sp. JC074]MCH4889254.1 hypothetical protein [Acidaminobacter sp. JC074]